MGARYGKLVVIGDGIGALWVCQCDCGGLKVTTSKQLNSGKTASCGCLASAVLAARNKTHGLSKSASYRSWKDMRSRCYNPNDSDYKDYGGRGIAVCARWQDFANFYQDMGDRPRGLTVDRINVNGNYEPSNCRWATLTTQANNKRTNVVITWNGVSKTLTQWARETGIDRTKARYRLAQGWSLDKVFAQSDFRR